jgi:polar amino acid transport system substrate-binding protein
MAIDTVQRALAPHGRLRAAINFGNPVLAQRVGDGARGVSPDLAHDIAQRLQLPLELVFFEGAGAVVAAAGSDVWDLAFLAIDPARAAVIGYTPPYVVIESSYLVPQGSPLQRIDEFDRPGLRIAVGRGAAYALYLERTLKQAELVYAPSSAEAVELYLSGRADAAASVRQPLEAAARAQPGHRVIAGRINAIEQALAVPKQGDAGSVLAWLTDYIEARKADGFVAAALQRSGQADAAVAPPAVNFRS